MKRYRAAIVGTGGIASQHAEGIQKNKDRLELVAAMDTDDANLAEFAKRFDVAATYTSVDDLLAKEKPDIVHICTPPNFHVDLSIKVMEAGAWAYCEKPIGQSLAEIDRLQTAEASTGQRCATVFQYRYGPYTQRIRDIVLSGELGRPLVAVCNQLWFRNQTYYDVPWRGKWSTELGGPTVTHGIHNMDQLLYMFGEWESVTATMGRLDRNIEFEDVSMAMVRFKNGAMASIVNSILCPRETTYLRMDFQRATLELEHVYAYSEADWEFTAVSEDEQASLLRLLPASDSEARSDHGAQLRQLVLDKDNDTVPATSGAEARNTLEFLSAMYKSATAGRVVEKGEIDTDDPFYLGFSAAAKSSALAID